MLVATNVLDGLGNSILSLLKLGDFVLFLDIPILIVLTIHKKKISIPRKIPLFIITFTFTTIFIVGNHEWLEQTKLLGNQRNWPLVMSPIGNHMYDFYRIMSDRTIDLTEHETNEIAEWHYTNSRFLTADSKYFWLEGNPEVVKIVVANPVCHHFVC